MALALCLCRFRRYIREYVRFVLFTLDKMFPELWSPMISSYYPSLFVFIQLHNGL